MSTIYFDNFFLMLYSVPLKENIENEHYESKVKAPDTTS